MIVCLCKGVSCGTIRQAIADGARTVDEVGDACGAGTDCGGCRNSVTDIVEEELSSPSVAGCGQRRLPVLSPRAA
ncbi:MAG: (2Fe-2S)-binding protein [Polyangiales bacterium]